MQGDDGAVLRTSPLSSPGGPAAFGRGGHTILRLAASTSPPTIACRGFPLPLCYRNTSSLLSNACAAAAPPKRYQRDSPQQPPPPLRLRHRAAAIRRCCRRMPTLLPSVPTTATLLPPCRRVSMLPPHRLHCPATRNLHHHRNHTDTHTTTTAAPTQL